MKITIKKCRFLFVDPTGKKYESNVNRITQLLYNYIAIRK